MCIYLTCLAWYTSWSSSDIQNEVSSRRLYQNSLPEVRSTRPICI